MPIIVSHKGKDAKRYDSQSFTDETELQEYITDNPEAVSTLTDIDQAEQRIFVAAREFPTESGPIDAVGFSRTGTIYLIETKLYRNTDKRFVLAQVLDYGASLWKHGGSPDEYIQNVDRACLARHQKSLREMATEFFDLDEPETELFISSIESNYEKAQFRFVVLMDKVDSRLKDLIFFINTNSNFDVYGVELEYYKVDDNEILIPRIWGEEVRKEVGPTGSGSERKKWNKESFFEELQVSVPEVYDKVHKLYSFAENAGLGIDFGTGAQKGTFTPKVTGQNGEKLSLFLVTTTGQLEILSGYWQKYNESLAKYKEFMEQASGAVAAIPAEAVQTNAYRCTIADISDEEIGKLIDVYKKIIEWAQSTELSTNPVFK